jgi:hypothetical protein
MEGEGQLQRGGGESGLRMARVDPVQDPSVGSMQQ